MDQDFASEEDNTSFRDSKVGSDEDSVDVISTGCRGEDLQKRSSGDKSLHRNNFSIENILGLDKSEADCEGGRTYDDVVESGISDKTDKTVKCVKPTPISATARSVGEDCC